MTIEIPLLVESLANSNLILDAADYSNSYDADTANQNDRNYMQSYRNFASYSDDAYDLQSYRDNKSVNKLVVIMMLCIIPCILYVLAILTLIPYDHEIQLTVALSLLAPLSAYYICVTLCICCYERN